MTRFFTLEYLERVTLRDGTPVVLRLLRPDDKQLLRDGFERLSPEARYTRFLAPKTTLTDGELRYLCEIDQEAHFALGAVHGVTGAGLGIARFVAIPGAPGVAPARARERASEQASAVRADRGSEAVCSTVAEAAITVADEVQHRGLGTLLLLRLCAAAAERGIERFRCEVLGSNTAMAALLARIAPDRTTAVDGGVMSIELIVPPVSPTEPPGTIPAGPVYRLLRATAENAVEWTSAVRALWRR